MTWMTTVSTINGRPHAQSADHIVGHLRHRLYKASGARHIRNELAELEELADLTANDALHRA
jgi:hypothetical protein